MRLGFYANYTKDTAEFAYETGFKSLELSAWPGSSLDAEKTNPPRSRRSRTISRPRTSRSRRSATIRTISTGTPSEAKEAQTYFLKVLELAERMGIGVVATFAGRNQSKPVEENIKPFRKSSRASATPPRSATSRSPSRTAR